VVVVARHPCQQPFFCKIAEPGILQKLDVRVELVAAFMDRGANQLTNRLPGGLVPEVRPDYEGMF
jgi:hypothetical protein